MRVCDSRLHVPLLSFEATTTSPGPPPPPRPTEPTATVREGCRLPRPRRHKLRLGGFENLRDRATRLGRGARCSRPARGLQGAHEGLGRPQRNLVTRTEADSHNLRP